jgi:hypothetical protein
MKHIGFTGSSTSVTHAQARSLTTILRLCSFLGVRYLHHGDCIKADAIAHMIALDLGLKCWLHPPSNQIKRAYCKDSYFEEQPHSYLERNKQIVEDSEALIAVPDAPEHARSGTWSTIRYARKKFRPIIIIWPAGQFDIESNEP